MKTRCCVLLYAIAATLCVSTASAPGKTAGCPCSPCKCSPCTCGDGGSKGGGKHHGKEGHHDRDSSVGVGGTVDLSGVGHRTREADPFASGGNDKPIAHTEEKRTTKHKDREPPTNSFDEIKLTGTEAKDESNSPNTFNVDNEEQPKTEEKPKGKKPKPTWPKNIQNWLDLKAAITTAEEPYSKAHAAYYKALYEFIGKSDHLKQLYSEMHSACDKVSKLGEKATQEDRDACQKARKAVQTQQDLLSQDFDNSPDGKKLSGEMTDAQKQVKKAQQAADDAAKDIDEKTQKHVLKKMEKWAKEQAKEAPKEAAKD
ncbi:MAG TPA: hypothetical protein VH170_02275 [Chthoniobacterales bacterium]|nr:hypothetical protein [Chthoniobacterales bacterium]